MTFQEVGIASIKGLINALRSRRPGSPDYNDVYEKLSTHHFWVKQSLHNSHKHARRLFRKHKLTFRHLRHASTRAAAGAALAGSLFVGPVHSGVVKPIEEKKVAQAQIPSPTEHKIAGPDNPEVKKLSEEEFGDKIKEIMGPNVGREGRLTDAQLEQIKKLTKEQFGITVDAKTEKGFEFKEHYGMSGAEQHLPRHVGDTAAAHVSPDDPLAITAGITRGRGAWGYVPSSKENGTENREKWYVVGRTMDSDQFGTEASKGLGGQRYLTIQIPQGEQDNNTFVGVGELWDAGPGRSTGKIWGHSPEYWYHFGQRAGRSRKTQVIMLPVTSDMPVSELGPVQFAK